MWEDWDIVAYAPYDYDSGGNLKYENLDLMWKDWKVADADYSDGNLKYKNLDLWNSFAIEMSVSGNALKRKKWNYYLFYVKEDGSSSEGEGVNLFNRENRGDGGGMIYIIYL